MTDDERKAWEELVVWVIEDGQSFEEVTAIRPATILAADAELKRLREAVEWVCSLSLPGNTVSELRRRAKEG
jgi:hypothetical protein